MQANLETKAYPLPKILETDERFDRLQKLIVKSSQKLWSASKINVVAVPFTQAVQNAISQAQSRERIIRGLESIERKLDNEAAGLEMVDKRTNRQRSERISRLLVLSNDGAERFYRKIESILRDHGHRVMALRVDVDSTQLGAAIGRDDKMVKLLLVEHKEEVANILLALLDPA